MNRYENTIYSGDEIIGNIPHNWNISPLKYVAQLSGKKNNDGIKRKMLSVSQYLGIIEKEYEHDEQRRTDKEAENYWVVEDQNLVANTMWLNYRGIGVSNNIDGYVSPAYRVYQLNTYIIESKFIHYLMRSDLYVGIYTKHLKGIRPNSLQVSTYDFQRINIVSPPLQEQKLIARYLDKKTAQIDLLIEKIEKKIALLKEKRTALINQCVTKGLDPNVEMKDSGIEWIGKIPKHWVKSKIKYERSIEKYSLVDGPFGSDLKSEHFTENGGVFVIESGFITKGKFIKSRAFKEITLDYLEKIKRSECYPSDIIIAKIGEYYGMSSILPDLGKRTVISGNCCRLKISDDNNIDFFHFILLNLRYSGVIQKEVNQTGQPFISLGVIDNLFVFVPPINEQNSIAKSIKYSISICDKKTAKHNLKIKLLKEYRQALISSVVTGKVRVTEAML